MTSQSIQGLRRIALTYKQPDLEKWLLVAAVIFLGIGLVAPQLLSTQDPLELSANRLAPPSSQHWFGTDHAGRDIFSRCIYALRPSLGASLIVVLFAATVGTTLGAIAGYIGGRFDSFLMRMIDIFLAFPYLILAIALSVSLGAGVSTSIIVLSVLWWPSYARQVRGQVLSLRNEAFVDLAKVSLVPTGRIVQRHLWPHLAPHIAARASMAVGNVILAFTALSFLGLGAQPPAPELGSMIAQGRGYMLTAWWYSLAPGLFIALIVMTSLSISDRIQRKET